MGTRAALTDEQIPPAKRQAIIEDLLGGKATSTTTQLVSMVVGSGRGRDLPAIIDKLVARASSAKNLEVAEVRTAVALTADQQDRLNNIQNMIFKANEKMDQFKLEGRKPGTRTADAKWVQDLASVIYAGGREKAADGLNTRSSVMTEVMLKADR